jgi:hypothetical protein
MTKPERIGTATVKTSVFVNLSGAAPARRKRKQTTPEADFQEQVIALARLHGWRVAHFRKVRVQRKNGTVYWETPVAADGKGFPDLILVRGSRIIAAELKTDAGALKPEQTLWLDAFRGAGVLALVWRPVYWNAIEAELQLRTAAPPRA